MLTRHPNIVIALPPKRSPGKRAKAAPILTSRIVDHGKPRPPFDHEAAGAAADRLWQELVQSVKVAAQDQPAAGQKTAARGPDSRRSTAALRASWRVGYYRILRPQAGFHHGLRTPPDVGDVKLELHAKVADILTLWVGRASIGILTSAPVGRIEISAPDAPGRGEMLAELHRPTQPGGRRAVPPFDPTSTNISTLRARARRALVEQRHALTKLETASG